MSALKYAAGIRMFVFFSSFFSVLCVRLVDILVIVIWLVIENTYYCVPVLELHFLCVYIKVVE